jgi:hypothetical protein
VEKTPVSLVVDLTDPGSKCFTDYAWNEK